MSYFFAAVYSNWVMVFNSYKMLQMVSFINFVKNFGIDLNQ